MHSLPFLKIGHFYLNIGIAGGHAPYYLCLVNELIKLQFFNDTMN